MSSPDPARTWTPAPGRVLDIGVCGLGSIGRRHIRLLAERSDVRAHAFDPAFDVTESAHLGVVVESSYGDLLANADGVVIAAPDASHAPLTSEACRAGVAVLVEKPVADSTAAARDMRNAAEANGVPVLVGHVLRHVAVVQRARQLLGEAATIGTPVSFHATLGAYETLEAARMRFAEPQPYRLAFDYVHEWDYLQHLLGPIARCAAVATSRGQLPLREHPNVIEAVLELENGIVGTVHLDYVEREGARSARFVGDRGVLTIDLRTGSLVVAGGDGRTRREDHAEERDASFTRQLDHFVDVVRGQAAPLVPVAEATRALAVSEAIGLACERRAWAEVAGV